MVVPAQACHPVHAAETIILWRKLSREPATFFSTCLFFKYQTWEETLKKEQSMHSQLSSFTSYP